MKEQILQSSHPTTAALFPGQGSQRVGMGKDLYENFGYVRELFEEASDSIHQDLRKLCFDGPESDLTLTHNTQPCLLLTSVAALRVAEREFAFVPGAVAGHSLGEYSALVASHSLKLSTAIKWVRERGLAMQEAVPVGEGTMAAVLGLDDSIVESLCVKATQSASEKRKTGDAPTLSVPAVIEPANFNAPGQVVISGSIDAIEEAIRLVKTDETFKGGKALPLSVSAPFHCQLMGPARTRMSTVFSSLSDSEKPKVGVCPIVPNRTARFNQETGIILDLLMEQIDHPVLWKQSMVALMGAKFTTFIEFGPGKVLTGLLKRIPQNSEKPITTHAVGDTASLKTLEAVLKPVSPTL